MMVCHTIRMEKELQMSNKHDGLLYLVLEPKNEIGGLFVPHPTKEGRQVPAGLELFGDARIVE